MSAPKLDDRSQMVVDWILEQLDSRAPTDETAFIVGLNGVQGIGKTTLVTAISNTLNNHHNLKTLTLSIDDFYLTRTDQIALAAKDPQNPLVQHRGQPSTHDHALAIKTLTALKNKESNVPIPAYDKSAHNGAGDRIPEEQWHIANAKMDTSTGKVIDPVRVVLFEGWCVGFRFLTPTLLRRRWQTAVTRVKYAAGYPADSFAGRLGHCRAVDVRTVNNALYYHYRALTALLDILVVLDAEDPQWVYDWRLEAEHALRQRTGQGMSDAQVKEFIDGYYPSYELYSDDLRTGKAFRLDVPTGAQLTLTVGKDRQVLTRTVHADEVVVVEDEHVGEEEFERVEPWECEGYEEPEEPQEKEEKEPVGSSQSGSSMLRSLQLKLEKMREG